MWCNRGQQSDPTLAFGWERIMRLALWRSGKDKLSAQKSVKSEPVAPKPVSTAVKAAPASGDLDLRTIGQALWRKKSWILVPTLLAAAVSMGIVNLVTPRYKSEVRILIDGRENIFLRPNGERNDER